MPFWPTRSSRGREWVADSSDHCHHVRQRAQKHLAPEEYTYRDITRIKMTKRHRRTGLLVASVLTMITACKDPGGIAGCGIELESALLSAASPASSPSSANLVLHLRMFNDTPLKASIRRLLWTVEVDGQALSRGNTAQSIQILPGSSQPNGLSIPLSEAAAQWVAAAMNKPHRQVRLMGFCKVEIAGAVKEVAFDAKQDVY